MLDTTEELLLFHRLPSVGASSYWKLLEHFASIHAALQVDTSRLNGLLPDAALAVIRDYQTNGDTCFAAIQAKKDREFAEKHDITLLSADDELYPEMLREIKRPPPLLYVAGDPSLLSFPQIAMVGSRNPTPSGRSTAFDFAAALASAGFTITSGLALGVDACAHKGALSVHGRTIGVLGTGLDQCYPLRNKSIAEDIIAKGGAIVSEFPLGTTAMPANFPQRNRIISGLSSGTLVVEAAVKSGSLITARYALQQNRELFAIPGSIHNPLAKGCHALIKEGAKLVETADDIVSELQGFLRMQWQQLPVSTTSDGIDQQLTLGADLISSDFEEAVLQHLGYDPMPIDVLSERSQLPVGDVMACLLTMELKGLVANIGTGYMLINHTIADFGFSVKRS